MEDVKSAEAEEAAEIADKLFRDYIARKQYLSLLRVAADLVSTSKTIAEIVRKNN